MEKKTLQTRIQHKYDTAANWKKNDSVILLAGEIGVESDTRLVKVGDGVSTWAKLEYINDTKFGLTLDPNDSECLVLTQL